MKRLFLTAALEVVCASAVGQTFQNIDFGLTHVPNATPWGTQVLVSDAFPFWAAYFGVLPTTHAGYNGGPGADGGIALITPDDTADEGIPPDTAFLQAGSGSFGLVSVALAQTAQFPAETMSLLFVATPPNGGGWQVSVGGQTIPVVEVSQVDTRFNEYEANISGFAGLTEELRFTALPGTSGANLWLGEIQFSPTEVPEPSPLALFGLGLVGIAGSAPPCSDPATAPCLRISSTNL